MSEQENKPNINIININIFRHINYLTLTIKFILWDLKLNLGLATEETSS